NNYGTGFTPYFMPLALWVGALIQFFILNMRDNRFVTLGVNRFTMTIGKWGTFAVLGALQAIIASFSLIAFLHLHPVNVIGFYLFNILLSWCFVSILYLLVQVLGMAGRFFGLVLLMLQLTSDAGTFPLVLVPNFFRAINPYLPMTYGAAALRQLVSGSASISLSFSIWMIVAFTVGALGLSILTNVHWLRAVDLQPSEATA
nr:YhgE/Pip domain-containing protein [Bacilli bacterium]